jgi:hypothetical protein
MIALETETTSDADIQIQAVSHSASTQEQKDDGNGDLTAAADSTPNNKNQMTSLVSSSCHPRRTAITSLLMTLTNNFFHHHTTNVMCHVNAGDAGPTTAEYRFPWSFQTTDMSPPNGTPHEVPASGKRRSGPTLHKKKRSYDLRDDFQTAGFAAGHHRGSSAPSEVVGGSIGAHSGFERSPPLGSSGEQQRQLSIVTAHDHPITDTGQENVPRPRL